MEFGAVGHILGGFAFRAEVAAHFHFDPFHSNIALGGFTVNAVAVAGRQGQEEQFPTVDYFRRRVQTSTPTPTRMARPP